MGLFVTTYKNPDLDGTACSYAYSEYLNKKGIESDYGIIGTPLNEVDFVVNEFNLDLKIENQIPKYTDIVLVDVSDVNQISSNINPLSVKEIFDHRKVYDVKPFSNAKVQIEQVGACATLIAEKFFKDKIEISKESAALLYFAIASNTLNYQNKITTDRDFKMSDWLKERANITDDYLNKFFVARSNIEILLKDYLLLDYYGPIDLNGKITGIGQLELVNIEEFVSKNLETIQKFSEERLMVDKLDVSFVNIIDVEKSFNLIITNDVSTQKILEEITGSKFNNSVLKTEEAFMRKELIYKIKNAG